MSDEQEAATPAHELDCLSCGACCAPPIESPTYVEVTDKERNRLPGRYFLEVIEGELATVPRPGGVRCIALKGTLGRSVRCAVHVLRPSACRRFRVGSQACLEARRDVLGISEE